jgi:hypothetical protein
LVATHPVIIDVKSVNNGVQNTVRNVLKMPGESPG